MNSMLSAEPAILTGLKTFRMVLLLLRSIVVTLLALCTCQCDSHAHNFHLQLQKRYKSGLSLYCDHYPVITGQTQGLPPDLQAVSQRTPLTDLFLSIKKRPIPSPDYYITPRQGSSIIFFKMAAYNCTRKNQKRISLGFCDKDGIC